MPKSIVVDPEQTQSAGRLAFAAVDLHAYATPFADEVEARGGAQLRAVLRHMMIIREFESMLASFKATGAYAGIAYLYKGPAHLSIGQEAAAVGAALGYRAEDHIYGSHRSHGEFIAKGLAAIDHLDVEALEAIMAAEQGGAVRDAVAHGPGGKAHAERFLLFGFLSEIFMRSNGFNGGMGGSMHAFFPPFGAYPNNAIVGASAGIATGAALHKKRTGSSSICVAHAGDGSTGCGPVWEAMNFAAMAQFDRLWADKGGLPILFFFTNNFYAMGGQTIGETMGWDRLSRIGAAVNAASAHAETVDGTNPLAVADAVARKRALLVAGKGPALLDVECYRYSGHSTTDVNAYRSREEMKAWEAQDPIALFAAEMTGAGVMDAAEVEAMRADVAALIEGVTRLAVDPAVAPPVDVAGDPTLIGRKMFSDQDITLGGPIEGLSPESSATFRQIKRKARFGIGPDGPLSPLRAVTIRDGLYEAILHHMTHDARLVAYGEECRDWGGAFGVYKGLADFLPHDRLFNAPISEAAIVATAVGHALEGGRSLVELMYGDFIGRAGDEIFNQMSKWQAMSAGVLKMPVVLRCSVGSKYGAQHSQDWTSLVAHIPGLKVVYPATAYDAKGLMASALSSNDPVVFFESQRLYDKVEQFREVPEAYYKIAMGTPDVKREGSDLTVLTIGPSLYPALAAAEELETLGLSAEVIDVRSLVPFDYAPVLASIKKTGHLVVMTEANERGSFAMTLAANISRFGFSDLKAAPRVIGAPNWIVPGADMEDTFFPQVNDVIDVVTSEFYPSKRVNKRGIRNWDDRDLAKHGL